MNHRAFLGPFITLVFVLLIAAPAPSAAIGLNGEGVLIGSVFRPEIGDEVLVFVSNTGRRPIRAEIQLRRAEDFSVVSTSGPLPVASRETATGVFIPDDFPVLVVVRYRTQGRTSAQVSLQVQDATGATRIFADGFESGDTSAF